MRWGAGALERAKARLNEKVRAVASTEYDAREMTEIAAGARRGRPRRKGIDEMQTFIAWGLDVT